MQSSDSPAGSALLSIRTEAPKLRSTHQRSGPPSTVTAFVWPQLPSFCLYCSASCRCSCASSGQGLAIVSVIRAQRLPLRYTDNVRRSTCRSRPILSPSRAQTWPPCGTEPPSPSCLPTMSPSQQQYLRPRARISKENLRKTKVGRPRDRKT